LQQLEVQKKFTTTERMRQLYHEFNTNKTEQIHSHVTNVFLPKQSYYCRTICGRARTYVAVSINSIGYYKYNRRLYLDLGMVMSSITAAFLKQQDQRKLSDQEYEKRPARRKIRAQKRLDNINFEWKREVDTTVIRTNQP
jgi:hypothetical protein